MLSRKSFTKGLFSSSKRSSRKASAFRYHLLTLIIFLSFFLIAAKLFYWQIIEGALLRAAANDQYQKTLELTGVRGSIFTADGHLLVGNQISYRLFAHPYLLTESPLEITDQLLPLLLTDLKEYQEATREARRVELEDQLKYNILERLSQKDSKWTSLMTGLSDETREKISSFNNLALGFEPQAKRFYPEASMAAHLTGFVGKTEAGFDIGYFGVEGALEKELKARTSTSIFNADALGLQLAGGLTQNKNSQSGRDLVLTIRRDLQKLAETQLAQALERYGAAAGEVIILEPATGKILALATLPSFDQKKFNDYDPVLYKSPALVSLFEPGSILKLLTVSAGIDEGVITPETVCTRCAGPRTIGKYTLKTWNEEYHPDITMRDALAKSDNVAMIFVAEELGSDVLREYLKKFRLGDKLLVDLQGDNDTPFPDKWGPVELATISFGQGISTTSLQLIRAVSTIANGGVMMQPQIIEKVIDSDTGSEIEVEPKEVGRVIKNKTAQSVTEMMVHAAESGEAQWIYSKTHTIAGKTGTSQVASEGGYSEDKTIAGFIGFAPPDNPKFVMMVKLVEPQSSPWAADTAAPLWYKIAERVFLMMNIAPDR